MFSGLAKSIFGDSNSREIKKFDPLVDAIASHEEATAALDDAALTARTDQFRARLDAGESIDDILPEAFATVREAAKRTIGQRHFDVQMMGALSCIRGASPK